MNTPLHAPCFCGATNYEVAATGTLLQCRACGRVWTRASGAWVMDDLTPARLEEACKGTEPIEVSRRVLLDAAADFIKLEFEAPSTVTYTPQPTDKPGEPFTLVWKKP